MNHSIEDALLSRMHEATERGLLSWITDNEDANRDLWRSQLEGKAMTIEILYTPHANGNSFERFAIEINALGTQITASRGTERYDRVMDMLSYSMPGWRESLASTEKNLKRAVDALDSLIKKND